MRAAIRDLPEELFPCTRAEANERIAALDLRIAALDLERAGGEKAARIAEIEAAYASS
jgi:hypothetical protein